MLSYRQSLTKIGIPKTAFVSYRNFSSRPDSLRKAMASMDAPKQWSQVSDIFRDDDWTDEVQGVAWDGTHWMFSANANQSKPGANDKAIYVFNGGATLADGNWASMLKYKDVSHPIAGLKESDDHWGQLTYYKGYVYVSHIWAGGPKKSRRNVVVFSNDGGNLTLHKWIELKSVTYSDGGTGYPEFQAINPWDGTFYSCRGGDLVDEFFIYDPNTDSNTGTLHLAVPCFAVQGACFSPNGHLYVSVDVHLPADWETRWKEYCLTAQQLVKTVPLFGDVEAALNSLGGDHKWIFCYSALNGALLGKIPVLAEQSNQELEGICYGSVSWPDGRKAQIHVVLLENPDIALDNIFFKSFSADQPDVV